MAPQNDTSPSPCPAGCGGRPHAHACHRHPRRQVTPAALPSPAQPSSGRLAHLREVHVAQRQVGALHKDGQPHAAAARQVLDVRVPAVLAARHRARRLAGNRLPLGRARWHRAQQRPPSLGQAGQRARVQDPAQRDLVGAARHQGALPVVPHLQQLVRGRSANQAWRLMMGESLRAPSGAEKGSRAAAPSEALQPMHGRRQRCLTGVDEAGKAYARDVSGGAEDPLEVPDRPAAAQ